MASDRGKRQGRKTVRAKYHVLVTASGAETVDGMDESGS
jgi:hypothetical protein